MERVENDYCWNTVKDWQEALKRGFIKVRDLLYDNEEENLRDLICLAVNDCFPLQMICVTINENRYIMTDPLMRKFLQFVDNKMPLIDKGGEEIFFEQILKEKQDKILNSKVNSVWIRMEHAEKMD